MKASGKITVTLSGGSARQLRRLLEDEAFASPAAAVEEALRFWLQSHSRSGGRTRRAANFMKRAFASPRGVPLGEPYERVELLFDAADAKA